MRGMAFSLFTFSFRYPVKLWSPLFEWVSHLSVKLVLWMSINNCRFPELQHRIIWAQDTKKWAWFTFRRYHTVCAVSSLTALFKASLNCSCRSLNFIWYRHLAYVQSKELWCHCYFHVIAKWTKIFLGWMTPPWGNSNLQPLTGYFLVEGFYPVLHTFALLCSNNTFVLSPCLSHSVISVLKFRTVRRERVFLVHSLVFWRIYVLVMFE